MVIEYLPAVKAAFEFAKAVKASTDAMDDAQIKFQVAELINALTDARIQAAESAELIASLQQQLKSKSEMRFDGSVYYRVKEGGGEDGPWCPTCYDARGLEIRLQKINNPRSNYAWRCKECNAAYIQQAPSCT